MMILRGPDQSVASLAFSPDATTLYAVHLYLLRAWNLADRTASTLETEKGAELAGEFAVHPGGRWVFGLCPRPGSPANPASAFDLTTRRIKPLNFLGRTGQHIALSPD